MFTVEPIVERDGDARSGVESGFQLQRPAAVSWLSERFLYFKHREQTICRRSKDRKFEIRLRDWQFVRGERWSY